MTISNTIKNLTVKETIVYRYALETCMYDYCVDVEDISNHCGMSVASAKGVVGSLVKKGVLDAQENERNLETFHDLFASTPDGHCFVAFGDENLSDNQLIKVRNYLQNIEESDQIEVPVEKVVKQTKEEMETAIPVIKGIIETFQGAINTYADALADVDPNDKKRYVVVIGEVLCNPIMKNNRVVGTGGGQISNVVKFTKEDAEKFGNDVMNGNQLRGHAENWVEFLSGKIVKTTLQIRPLQAKVDEMKEKLNK